MMIAATIRRMIHHSMSSPCTNSGQSETTRPGWCVRFWSRARLGRRTAAPRPGGRILSLRAGARRLCAAVRDPDVGLTAGGAERTRPRDRRNVVLRPVRPRCLPRAGGAPGGRRARAGTRRPVLIAASLVLVWPLATRPRCGSWACVLAPSVLLGLYQGDEVDVFFAQTDRSAAYWLTIGCSLPPAADAPFMCADAVLVEAGALAAARLLSLERRGVTCRARRPGGVRSPRGRPRAGRSIPLARRELEEAVPPLSTSLDGRRFSFQASSTGSSSRWAATSSSRMIRERGSARYSRSSGRRWRAPKRASPATAARADVPGRGPHPSGRRGGDDPRGGRPAFPRRVSPTGGARGGGGGRVAASRARLEVGELTLAPGVSFALDAGGFDRHTFLAGSRAREDVRARGGPGEAPGGDDLTW